MEKEEIIKIIDENGIEDNNSEYGEGLFLSSDAVSAIAGELLKEQTIKGKGWIDAKEPPEHSNEVLVDNGNSVQIAYYDKRYEHIGSMMVPLPRIWLSHPSGTEYPVLRWMEKPTP